MKLWVKETWAYALDYSTPDLKTNPKQILYKADSDILASGNKWRPAIFMPRQASRILLEITELWVERVQDITADCAIAEGMPEDTPVMSFAALWNFINAKRSYSWERNPWVWVIGFKLIEGVKYAPKLHPNFNISSLP